MFDHGLLDRVLSLIAFQMLNRDDMCAMQAGDKADAGIDALIAQLALFQPSHQHGARTAIALSAPFFGTAERFFNISSRDR